MSPRSKKVAAEAPASSETTQKHLLIQPPKLRTAIFEIIGTAPLVIHRFSQKVKQQMLAKQTEGKSASSKKKRDPQDLQKLFVEARYISKEGWDGFHAAAVRNAMISACRLVSFKMTLAKMSIFVVADGVDKDEPQIPLVQIRGCKAVMQQDMARVETGQPYITTRAAYHNWSAKVKIRFDEDQFSVEDVSNLLARVGEQVGLCEGRFDSKNSAGMGWGAFRIASQPQTETQRIAAD